MQIEVQCEFYVERNIVESQLERKSNKISEQPRRHLRSVSWHVTIFLVPRNLEEKIMHVKILLRNDFEVSSTKLEILSPARSTSHNSERRITHYGI